MRDMRPDPEILPSRYICSDCNWSFPLSRLSDLADFFQQKDAILAFSTHVCGSFPFIRGEDNGHSQGVASELDIVDPEANPGGVA